MRSMHLRWTVLAAAGLRFANAADKSDIVPEELQGGFESSGVDLQVSYTGEAENGFKDGAEFETDAVAQAPTFALGDSSAISSTSLYTVVMIDTTCDQARTLHFAQSNFKFAFEAVNIKSESAQLQEYKAPGSFGEKGDERKYSFLMFDNPNREEISELKLPSEGEAFDVNQFRDDNGFEDAVAGVGMVVKLGGQANCDGPSDGPNDQPESSSVAEPASSSRATPSEVVSSSAAARTSSPASRSSSASSDDEATTTEAQEPESTASEPSETDDEATTTEAQEPESTASEPSETDDGEDTPSSTTEESGSATDLATEASSVLLSPSTALVTTTLAESTGSPTASTSLALQTDSSASGLSTVTGRCMVAGLLVALAACLA